MTVPSSETQAWRFFWFAVLAFVFAAVVTACGSVDLKRSVDGMSKALRAGAIGLEQADGIIEVGTDLRIARCSEHKTEVARTKCMGLLDADHQARIAELISQLGNLYDMAAKSLPKIEAILVELERYIKAARGAK